MITGLEVDYTLDDDYIITSYVYWVCLDGKVSYENGQFTIDKRSNAFYEILPWKRFPELSYFDDKILYDPRIIWINKPKESQL